MSKLSILIVEDVLSWSDLISETVKDIVGETLHIAKNYIEAATYIQEKHYDLIVVDLALPDDSSDQKEKIQRGFDLFREVRSSIKNAMAALLVVSAQVKNQRVVEALKRYDVHDFLEKEAYAEEDFLRCVGEAILMARLKRAGKHDSERYRLTISLNKKSLTGSKLIGPNRHTIHNNRHKRQFDVADLVRRTDLLNWMIIKGGPKIWRPEARSVGKAVYEVLASERQILADLTTAQALAKLFSDVWLEFCSPARGLGLPFELLREKNKPLALYYVLTRKLNGFTSRKPEPFHEFVENLHNKPEKMRVLIISPEDASLPAARKEAESLKKSIESNLILRGIVERVDLPVGDDASYPAIKQTLHDGNYHIIHYAGHGKLDDELPEKSGLKIKDKDGVHILTAADLSSLLRDKTTRMVFLSACLSASTASDAGRGDFHSLFEAIAEADVPIVAGYRWEVDDEQAMLLAEHFYDQLWRTFSPGEAMLRARQMASRGEQGRDDETWASPVLLVQNN